MDFKVFEVKKIIKMSNYIQFIKISSDIPLATFQSVIPEQIIFIIFFQPILLMFEKQDSGFSVSDPFAKYI